MNIIFLDIDGVLNSNFWNESHEKEISDGTLIDMEKIHLLHELVVDTSAELVLHSGWKYWFDNDLKPLRQESARLENMLMQVGLKITDVTPDLATEEIKRTKKFSMVKASEILQWLSSHDECNWVVLDDLELYHDEISRHQVMTDSQVGLTTDDILEAKAILYQDTNPFLFEVGGIEDLQEIFHLIQLTGSGLIHPDSFVYSQDPKEYERLLLHSPCVVVRHENQIVGAFLTYAEDDDYEAVYAAAEVDPHTSIIFDTCVVHPDYRGNHLERRMAEWLLWSVRKQYQTAICTISPENSASIKSLTNVGFHQWKKVKLYGGKVRYLFKRELTDNTCY